MKCAECVAAQEEIDRSPMCNVSVPSEAVALTFHLARTSVDFQTLLRCKVSTRQRKVRAQPWSTLELNCEAN